MATLTTFIAGFCTHKACMAVRGASLTQTCQFPAQCVLIQSQDQDKLWLWDTGYATHFFDASKDGVYRLYPAITPVYFEPDDAIIHQLKKLGIHPSDLSGVIVSHFHTDHIAGLKDFKNTPIWVSKIGYHAIKGLSGLSAVRQGFLPKLIDDSLDSHFNFVENLPKVSLPASLYPFEQVFGLSDDVLLIYLDGHAKGQLGAFVQTQAGWVLLGADAAWSHLNYQGRPPSYLAMSVMDNAKAYHRTLDKLAILHQNGVAIHLSHEVFGTSILEYSLG